MIPNGDKQLPVNGGRRGHYQEGIIETYEQTMDMLSYQRCAQSKADFLLINLDSCRAEYNQEILPFDLRPILAIHVTGTWINRLRHAAVCRLLNYKKALF
jgi:hypothetical protein